MIGVAVGTPSRIHYTAFDSLCMEAPLVNSFNFLMALAAVDRFKPRGMFRLHILQIRMATYT